MFLGILFLKVSSTSVPASVGALFGPSTTRAKSLTCSRSLLEKAMPPPDVLPREPLPQMPPWFSGTSPEQIRGAGGGWGLVGAEPWRLILRRVLDPAGRKTTSLEPSPCSKEEFSDAEIKKTLHLGIWSCDWRAKRHEKVTPFTDG